MSATRVKRVARWTPRLIRRLRGRRTLAEFAEALGTSLNTVWRWEAGRSAPSEDHVRALSDLGERERFLADWKLVGSMRVVGDLEEASRAISEEVNRTLERRAKELLD